MVRSTFLGMLMKTRYITSLPLMSFNLMTRDENGKMNRAVLTGEDTKDCHKTVASVIQDTIGFDRLDRITKKPLGTDLNGSSKEVEMDKNYLRGLLY